jgi:nicotinamidase-related amidase
MPLDLTELVAPAHTAVLTMESQRGVVGDLAMMEVLRDEIEAKGSMRAAGRLCAAARDVGVRVVHCTVENRADRAGGTANCRMLAAGANSPVGLRIGSEAVEVVPELGQAESDIVVARMHGMTPFPGTSLDQILRNLGVTTVVATGQSVNIGVVGLVLGAVDRGYQVVVPPDAVAGVPREYAEAMMENTIAYLATLVTTDELIEIWSAP